MLSLPYAASIAQPDHSLERVRAISNPATLGTRSPPKHAGTLLAPQGAEANLADAVQLDLAIRYIKSKIWNPARKRFDQVSLRGYQGPQTDPLLPYVAPTIEVAPGDTVRVQLNNNLPQEDSCDSWPEDKLNVPHCFNGTNLHTHGLWVSPAGNSDNVLLKIKPGVSFQYEYNIPSTHPAGTYWYHPHLHGSTALQVASGMAGALIVRGNRAPTDSTNGDLDVLLKPTSKQTFKERLFVFQQIHYACRGKDGEIKKDAAGAWACDKGDVGGIEKYDQFGPENWRDSGRFTSVNGNVLGTIYEASSGQIERWRLIHAGVQDTIKMEIRRVPYPLPAELTAAEFDHEDYTEKYCSGAAIPFHLVAADGLTLGKAQKRKSVVLQPGYRWDALITFPRPGKYCVIDAEAPPSGTVNRNASSRQLLGMVDVGKGQNVSELDAFLTAALKDAASQNLPRKAAAKVRRELSGDLSLESFVAHRDIEASEVTGTEAMTFNIDVNTSPVEFQVNGTPYDPSQFRVLTLGQVDEWSLRSTFASHPFHIHVNPFQIVSITDPNGKDVSELSAIDDAGGAIDTQYSGLKGLWKDTLWIKNLYADPDKPESGQYKITVRTRYERYIGDFVLHCHILDHEDQGMMQNVRISLPGVSGFGHH